MADARRLKRNPDVSWRVIEGQAVLILNKEGEVQVLNELGTFIWERAEEDPEEVIRAIVAQYEVTPEEAKKDLEEFVNSLLGSGALQTP
jgi:ribosomal protein L31E